MHSESRDSRSDLSKGDAKKLIDEIFKSLTEDKANFRDLASKHSDCSSASSGGSLGEFGKGMMVKPFEEMAFSLEINQVSKPFESEFGYHIVKREA